MKNIICPICCNKLVGKRNVYSCIDATHNYGIIILTDNNTVDIEIILTSSCGSYFRGIRNTTQVGIYNFDLKSMEYHHLPVLGRLEYSSDTWDKFIKNHILLS